MKKISLIIYSENDTEDTFKFDSLSELFDFINSYTAEKLIDDDFIGMKYDITVEG